MKIKMIDKSSKLPNGWKQCGVSKEEWGKLNTGSEIEVKSFPESINHLVEVTSSPKKEKGDK